MPGKDVFQPVHWEQVVPQFSIGYLRPYGLERDPDGRHNLLSGTDLRNAFGKIEFGIVVSTTKPVSIFAVNYALCGRISAANGHVQREPWLRKPTKERDCVRPTSPTCS